MTDYKPYNEMSDDEIVRTFKKIANRFIRNNNPVEAFKAYIAEHFDCSTPPRITYSKSDGGQRMFMGMTFSPTAVDADGAREILSF